MCTPTRAALLTGMYQHRFGRKFESALSGRAGKGTGLSPEAFTLAEALKEEGYATGMFGKWHLGYEKPYLPTRQGFDEFQGLLTGDGDHHTHIDRSGYEDWWNGEEIEMEEGYTADLLTKYSVRFLKRHKDEPFFLYVSHLAIHFPWQAPDDPPHRNKGKAYHSDKWGILPEKGDVSPHVKGMVESLDKGVGEIIATLQQLELTKNTLVIFTSDNGGYLTYDGGFSNISSNGPLRGQKTELYEGGHRVPAIAWWPGKIKPLVSDETVMSFDLFPTFLKLAGAKARHVDGIDLTELLLENQKLEDRMLFWKMGETRAVRHSRWKLISVRPGSQLYDLEADVSESMDLSQKYPDITSHLSLAQREWERKVLPK